MNICLALPTLELCFQVVRRWIMKEDLLVKLVYLCIGWVHDGRNKDTRVLCAQIGFPFLWPVQVQFITSQLYHSGEGYLHLQGRSEWW